MADTNEFRQRAEARRERLRGLLDRLEAALASPPKRDVVLWRTALHDLAAELGEELDDHIAATEGADGLFEEITARAPRLTGPIDRLRSDHPELHAAVAAFAAALATESADDEALERIRRLGSTLLIDLIRHRQRGADLLYEAYWVDVPQGD